MWKGFIFVWLQCYSTTDLTDDFLARESSHVDKSIIKGCKNVADTKYILSFSYLRSEADDLFFLLFLLFVKCHYSVFSLGYAMRKLIVFYVQVCKYVIQFSRVWLFVTPWTVAHQASLSITNYQSLLKLMSIKSVIPSYCLILCHPLPLLPSIFPSIGVFSNELALCIRWSKHWNLSFSTHPSNEYSGLIFFRI